MRLVASLRHVIGLAGAIATWQLLADLHVLDPRVVSTPSSVVVTAIQMFVHQSLLSNVGDTLWRFVVGLSIGAFLGCLIGLSAGASWIARGVFSPFLAAGLATPVIALFPLILLIFGINQLSYLIMIAIGPLFIMAISTAAAVGTLNPGYIEVATSYGASRRTIYRRVLLAGILPDLIGGLRLTVGAALLGTVAVEYLLVSNGLGYVIWQSWQVLSLRESIVGVVVVGGIGLISYKAVDFIAHFTDWRDWSRN